MEILKELMKIRDDAATMGYEKEAITISEAIFEIKRLQNELEKAQTELAYQEREKETWKEQ